MSFPMYLGFVVGILAGALAVVIGTIQKRRKNTAIESDERTELIKIRAGFVTFVALGLISYVGWVTDNVLRHLRGEKVAFFSPWGLLLMACCLIYIAALGYESWKVSDNSAIPDDDQMKKAKTALLCLGASALALGTSIAAADGRIDRSVATVLIGMLAGLGGATVVVIVRMYFRRQQATSGR
jgi:hypothetical protein